MNRYIEKCFDLIDKDVFIDEESVDKTGDSIIFSVCDGEFEVHIYVYDERTGDLGASLYNEYGTNAYSYNCATQGVPMGEIKDRTPEGLAKKIIKDIHQIEKDLEAEDEDFLESSKRSIQRIKKCNFTKSDDSLSNKKAKNKYIESEMDEDYLKDNTFYAFIKPLYFDSEIDIYYTDGYEKKLLKQALRRSSDFDYIIEIPKEVVSSMENFDRDSAFSYDEYNKFDFSSIKGKDKLKALIHDSIPSSNERVRQGVISVDDILEKLQQYMEVNNWNISKNVKDARRKADMIEKSRRTLKGRSMREGTGNFRSPDGPFDLVAYIIEDEDEDDYDYAVSDEYKEAADYARDLIDDLSSGANYYYTVTVKGGYYNGIQIDIAENEDPQYALDGDMKYFGRLSNETLNSFEYQEVIDLTVLPKNKREFLEDFAEGDYSSEEKDDLAKAFEKKFGISMIDVVKGMLEKQKEKFEKEINDMLDKLIGYGWMRLGVFARFNNGETWYNKKESATRNKHTNSSLRERAYMPRAFKQLSDKKLVQEKRSFRESEDGEHIGLTIVFPFEDTIIEDAEDSGIGREELNWDTISEIMDKMETGVTDYLYDILGNDIPLEYSHPDNGLELSLYTTQRDNLIDNMHIRDDWEDGMIVLEFDNRVISNIVDEALKGAQISEDIKESLQSTFETFTYIVLYSEEKRNLD